MKYLRILILFIDDIWPVLIEVEVGKFFLVPLVELQNVETDILIVNVDDISHVGYFV